MQLILNAFNESTFFLIIAAVVIAKLNVIEISFIAARKFLLYFKRFELAKMIHSLLSKHLNSFYIFANTCKWWFDLQIINELTGLQSRKCCGGIKINTCTETWIVILIIRCVF